MKNKKLLITILVNLHILWLRQMIPFSTGTQEIPVIDGPFSMQEIPGLILSVESKESHLRHQNRVFFDKSYS
jgi:hypothetical protein